MSNKGSNGSGPFYRPDASLPYALPQFTPSLNPGGASFANGALAAGLHPNLLMVAVMDGSVRPVTSGVGVHSWTMLLSQRTACRSVRPGERLGFGNQLEPRM
jgi:hypothetical protein